MKENIERIFKESLENYSVPYNSAAWDTMSKRLDATPSTPFYKKWWFAASVAVVAAGSALLFTASGTKETPASPIVQTTPERISAGSPDKTIASADNGITQENGESTANTATPPSVSNRPEAIAPADAHSWIERKLQAVVPVPHSIPATTPNTQTSVPADRNYLPLTLPKTVCLNEEIEISNPNKEELIFVKHPNGQLTGIKPNSRSRFNAMSAGTIIVSSGTHSDYIEVVKPEGSLYIASKSDTPYENGIPTQRFEVNGTDNEVNWTSSVNELTTTGNTLTVHPFTGTLVEVTATTTDNNGCKVSERKIVQLPETYNLLAMDAINPSSIYPANRTFMPIALKERDVAFDLMIVDPKTNVVIYTTSDASEGWDGTDSKTGQRAQTGSIWLWKVVIKNPVAGEKRVYNGTVQLVEN